MQFSKFTISAYRSYVSEQTCYFGIPNGEEGSGLTYIVGENNSGKTTLIEGICFKNQDILRTSDMYPEEYPSFQLYNNSEPEELIKDVHLLRTSGNILVAEPDLQVEDSFEIIPARRHWESNASDGNSTVDIYVRETGLSTPRNSHHSNNRLVRALKAIEGDTTKYLEFIKYIQQILPDFSSYKVGMEDFEFIEYTTKGGRHHKTDFLGDGVISIIRIAVHLFNKASTCLIIEEPELSLHPASQKRLLQFLGEESKTRQIIITTHSPYFISFEYLSNGAKLNKVVKEDDSISRIYTLKEFEYYRSLIKGANWQQPFLMDVVAKEIFFYDNVVFVEGQEDVGLLRREEEFSNTVNIFGYGVRGFSSFKFSLGLAKDLGIKKAAVILDGGENESREKQELESDFPEYKIVQMNREDIRDKARIESKAKEGYFDDKGRKKADLDDYDEKIKEINNYFER